MEGYKLFGPYVFIYFLGLGLIEVLWHWYSRRKYNWQESGVSIADMAIRYFVIAAIGGPLLVQIGPWLEKFRIADLPIRTGDGFYWGRAALLFFGLEFFYYWFHRWSHEIRWFWATHAVHHSPNSMNFMTAERLGWTQNISGAMLTFAPLFIIGFHTNEILAMFSLNLLYQYWLHTEIIGKLGPLEYVLNTPAHHRVHHASNTSYLDANYGGVLIIFDRLFGTYVEEKPDVPIVYGLVKPIYSRNPIYVALHEWINIAHDVKEHWRSPSVMLKYLFGRPGWSHDGSRKTSTELMTVS